MKVYKKGNYIYIVNESNGLLKSDHSSQVKVTKSTVNATGYTIQSDDLGIIDIDFSEIKDEAGVSYSSQSYFDDWYSTNTGFNTAMGGSIANTLKFVSKKSDFPIPISGVITLEDNVTYYVTAIVDLLGDRIIAGQNSVILGASSENCYLKSTGLNSSTALITGNYSLPIRNISFTHGKVFDLDGDGVTTALDWFGVNFVDCTTVGTIKDYSNFVMGDSSMLNSSGLTFDGTIGTIAFGNCLFDCSTGGTAITLPSTLTISRRLRIIYSSFITLSGETSINVNSSATIPVEGYILDTVNFAGGGTYNSGVQYNDNKALFINCKGVNNSDSIANYHMGYNATPTDIVTLEVPVKINGVTTANSINQKFTHSNNRATYIGAINRSFKITATLSVTSTSSNDQIGFYVAKNGSIITESEMYVTTNSNSRAESVTIQTITNLVTNDYIEIWVENDTDSSDVVITFMNVIIEALN